MKGYDIPRLGRRFPSVDAWRPSTYSMNVMILSLAIDTIYIYFYHCHVIGKLLVAPRPPI